MPTYDYRCNATGEVFEVKHRMNERLSTWGELCEQAGFDPGEIAWDSPVTRLATGGQVVKSSSLGERESSCGAGACGRGMCGMN
ncbi:MAG: zinc ribbon domain-containing protein [Methylococcaceae bacterium]|nr:zinc ribbon domain-containing protein [Methylococcaceae bacterium]MCI0733713.1 zinc ribbon domain-containing protein [Methylococcaceae bacterium]